MTNQDWYGDLTVGRVMTPEPIIKNGDHMEYAVYGLQEDGTVSIGNTPTLGKYLVLPPGFRAKDVQRAWYVFLKTIWPNRPLHSPDEPSPKSVTNYGLEEYRQKCQDALVAKGYLPKAIERIAVEKHYRCNDKPEDVAEQLYYEDHLDGTN